LLYEGIKLDILSKEDLNELERFINYVQRTETLEENENIFRENIKKNGENGYFIEIILRHKQRAVGLQAMVYLCIYVEILKDRNGNSLIGRTAEVREFGRFEITSRNKELITDVVKAFAIASQQHKNDISNILEQIKEKCKL